MRTVIDPVEAACRVIWPKWNGDKASYDLMVKAITAYEAAEDELRQCDVPGCDREATCGFPIEGGGYRRTCGTHYKRHG